LVENVLDDLFKLFLDPYFKPKNVDDPERENLFELMYSPGNTMNSKAKVNHRRDYTWDDLYISKDIEKEFMAHRFSSNKYKFTRLKKARSVNRTPKNEHENKRSITLRDENSIYKKSKNESLQLYSGYTYNNHNTSQSRINKNDMIKSKKNFIAEASSTEYLLPNIKNVNDDSNKFNMISKLFNTNKYVNEYFKSHSHSKTLLSKKKFKKQVDTAKVEEQDNFMTKFNEQVRKRNKMRNLKVGRSHTRVRKYGFTNML
jgi:hypothetical protein